MQTLYESWELRRTLLDSNSSVGASNAQAQRRILDYLMVRYADAPIAKEAAHFPARMELRIDRRAIVVHDHMGRGIVSAIKTEAEATDRASRILKRIARVDPQSSVKAPGFGILTDPEPLPHPNLSPLEAARGGIAGPPPAPPPGVIVPSYRQRLAWERVRSAIRTGEATPTVLIRIRHALELGPTLPRHAVEYLFNVCDNSGVEEADAAILLFKCDNASAPQYAMIAWRNRLATLGASYAVGEVLRTIFLKDDVRKLALQQLRPYLADVNAVVRVQAIKLLGELGGLNDVGLLLDLASLPRQSDEDPAERTHLLDTASHLSGMTTEQVQKC